MSLTNIMGNSRLVAVLQRKTNAFYKEFTNFQLIKQNFSIYDCFEETKYRFSGRNIRHI